MPSLTGRGTQLPPAYTSLLNPNTNYGFPKAINVYTFSKTINVHTFSKTINVHILFHNQLNKNII
jgi:hypothetical protein